MSTILAVIQQASTSASAKDKFHGIGLEAESEEARYHRDVVPQLHEVLRDVVIDDAAAVATDDNVDSLLPSSVADGGEGGHGGCCLVGRSVVEHEIKTAVAMAMAVNAMALARSTEAAGVGAGDKGGHHVSSTSRLQPPDTVTAGPSPDILAGGPFMGSKKKAAITATSTSSSSSAADQWTSLSSSSSSSSSSALLLSRQIQWMHRKFDNVFRKDRDEQRDLFDGACVSRQ